MVNGFKYKPKDARFIRTPHSDALPTSTKVCHFFPFYVGDYYTDIDKNHGVTGINFCLA